MTILKGELQADNGDVLYPHTSSQCVFAPDGKTVDEQINVLSGQLNGYRIYNSLHELGATQTTPVQEVSAKMVDKSILIDSIYDTSNNYPVIGGTLIVIKHSINRIVYNIFDYDNSREFRATFDNGFSGWKQIATTDKIDILCTPKPNINIVNNYSYIINDVAYLSFRITKNNMVVNQRIEVCSLPFNVGTIAKGLFANGFNASGLGFSVNGICGATGTTVYLTPTSDTNGMFDISGVILL